MKAAEPACQAGKKRLHRPTPPPGRWGAPLEAPPGAIKINVISLHFSSQLCRFFWMVGGSIASEHRVMWVLAVKHSFLFRAKLSHKAGVWMFLQGRETLLTLLLNIELGAGNTWRILSTLFVSQSSSRVCNSCTKKIGDRVVLPLYFPYNNRSVPEKKKKLLVRLFS